MKQRRKESYYETKKERGGYIILCTLLSRREGECTTGCGGGEHGVYYGAKTKMNWSKEVK